jgi:CubicO group peptidase (beta-lactamase class C family)
MQRLSWSLILPAILLSSATPAGAREENLAPVRKLLEDAVARKQIAGAAALVSHRGKVILDAAVGMRDAEAKKPMTTDTIFRIASMTKPITSAAVMMLVDDGKIALTDPLSKYVPQFRNPSVLVKGELNGKTVWTTRQAKREITIHDLLTHTSGISYRFLNRPHLAELYVKAGISDGISDTPGTMADNVKKLAALPLLQEPGAGFEYGLNTDVLGRVVEVASGKTLDEFFRERIFVPLKMTDSHFLLPKAKRDRLAAVYTPNKDGTIRPLGDKPVTNGPLVYSATYPIRDAGRYHSGGGGLVSTTGDYHRFLRMMLNKGELDGKRVLKAETVAKMTTDQIGKGGMKFGYGFAVVAAEPKGPGQSAGSYTWGGFFYTYFWVDPKQEVIGVLMTQLHPSGLKLNQEFVQQVYRGLGK